MSNSNSKTAANATPALAPALAVIGKVILHAQDLRELSWRPATESYGLSQHDAAMDAATQLIKQPAEVVREVAELVFMLNFLAWNDARLLADRLTALEGSALPGAESP